MIPQADTWLAPPGEEIPNHPSFPVLVYRGVDLSDAHRLLERHAWGGRWVDGVFDFHHFHSTSHETLAVVAGTASLELGGPQGRAFDVAAGDVLVLPAGTGHRRAAASPDFSVVGAYPPGQHDYDLRRVATAADRERIAALPAPPQDPVGGDGVARWVASGTA